MKTHTLACALLALLPTLGLGPIAAPNMSSAAPMQDADWVKPEPTPEIFYYNCKHRDAFDILDIADELFGRSVLKTDNRGRPETTHNIHVLDESRIIVFDVADHAKRVLTLLDELDVETPESARDAIEPDEELVSVEYRPRYLGISDLIDALIPFQRSLDPGAENISVLHDSGRLILRDYPEQLEEMRSLLKTIDVPDQQVELTCYILRGATEETPKSSLAPADLTENLARLVPYTGFELASMGVLRMTTAANSPSVSLHMPGTDEEYDLSLRIGAYDHPTDPGATNGSSNTGVLTLNQCSVMQEGDMGRIELFSTTTSIAAGEYAVMGASGAEPIFVVLRFMPVGG
jgi:hypothetical protein